MNQLKTGIFIIIICISVSCLHAQSYPVENMSFQNLTINDGLSQGMVNQILQDRYGFMWFATKDGLNRYDGYHFKTYRHDADDTSSLTDSYVQSLLEDSHGRIWAGTSSGNVDFFDHATGKFQHIIPGKNKLIVPDGPAQQVLEDKQGNIWVRYFSKLYLLKFAAAGSKNLNSIEEIRLPKISALTFIFISESGTIFCFETGNPEFYIFQQGSQQWSKKMLFDSNQKNNFGKQSFGINNIVQSSTSNDLF
ncbi:MAG: two-component regulator propeller domain-containing protein, partial [Bacteroidota bacterium]